MKLPRWWLLVVIATLFAVRNLPWHLDDFDQAKQAYTSYEMIEEGHWWFQHTPTGRVATKPPLAGWISAGLYKVVPWWDGAWRLPVFASALALLWLLWRAGLQLGGTTGGFIAAGAFGLNLWMPRLATLVRTDMLLTLTIFGVGYIIYEKIRRAERWTTRDRWAVAALLLASMLTKGPIAYAFLLPGLALFAWVTRRSSAPGAWSGWWAWALPLVAFLAWAGVGLWMSEEFYDQVVMKEFLGRFTVGEEAVHRNQPPWFYVIHLLHKWAPWSMVLGFVLWQPAVRARLRVEPALLWLLCWAAGGLLVMSLIPSKRPDRIVPVVPPLCLLLAGLCVGHPMRRWLPHIAGVAIAIAGGYTAVRVILDFKSDQRALVRFGAEAMKHKPLTVVNGKDEGMLMYTGVKRFTRLGDAVDGWKAGDIQWLVLSERDLKKAADDLGAYERVAATGKVKEKHGEHVLIRRVPVP